MVQDRYWNRELDCPPLVIVDGACQSYDRRGHLKAFWKETIDFLIMHEIPIAAEVMMQIQEIEEGSPELLDFIDDDALRKRQEPAVKQEQFDRSQVVVRLP